jgi:transketolase
MYCVKPIDVDAITTAAKETKVIITIEEHVAIGGMSSIVSQIVGRVNPIPVINLTLPDTPVVSGKSQEVFDHYGLNADGIVKTALELLGNV